VGRRWTGRIHGPREQGVVWFSEDLETWQEIHLPGYGSDGPVWGWGGPFDISIERKVTVITLAGERLIGTRP